MFLRRRFADEYPGVVQLDVLDPESLTVYLRGEGWIGRSHAATSVDRAGESNMNLVLRVGTTGGALILKQARPWVEKYPDIAAPWDRTLVEGAFYALLARERDLSAGMPAFIGVDERSHVLALGDVRDGRDCTTIYRGDPLRDDERAWLVEWLRRLHRTDVTATERTALANREMRRLNHEHIFRFPLDPHNGLELDAIAPGLAEAARELQRNERYVARARALGERYLGTGPALLHGDYFPGSWLRGADGLRVIDFEFAFPGPPEFDVGIMAAHVMLAGEETSVTDALIREYGDRLDVGLVRAFAGVELMRRIIGVAQLPLAAGLEIRRRLLDASVALVLGD